MGFIAAKDVARTLEYLRAERGPLAARLDALELAIENLARFQSFNGAPATVDRRRVKNAPRAPAPGARLSTKAKGAARRDRILELLSKAPEGLTVPQLRKGDGGMTQRERGNTLQRMKANGQIVREGNAWRLVSLTLS